MTLLLPQAPAHAPADRIRFRDRLAALWTRRREPAPPESDDVRIRRLEEARAVLEGAHTILERGWVQDAYFLVRTRRGRLRAVGPLGLGVPKGAEVTAACLVGAVVHAGRLRNPTASDSDHFPVLDLVWETLREQRPGATTPDLVAPSPAVRAARVRELTRWNDEAGRTSGQVLRLVDSAISRSIVEAVRRPATV